MFGIWFEIEQGAEIRMENMLKDAEQNRLVRYALKESNRSKRNKSKILARIGKEIAALGSSLEERYGDNADADARIYSQSSAGGYS